MTPKNPAAKTPYTHCIECKGADGQPVALVSVRASEKQVEQKCPKCGMQHITGLPASTYTEA